jgi:SAM-dependent methyltransferase
MNSVDYSFWANYVREIHQNIGKKTDIALELGSGNCKLAKYLYDEFSKLFLTDISYEMLKFNKTNYPVICCDMKYLPFKNNFDFIFSAFDSINYINTEEKLLNFFIQLSKYLTSNGYFVFDVSLKKNSIKHLKKLNREGTYRGIKYIQKSEFDEETSLHINTVHIITKDGKKYKEVHTQKIYDFYYYFDILDNAGLVVTECFDGFSFENASEESDRIQFIVKRKT